MPLLANVALTNTFDEWRVRTNQLVVKTNDMELVSANAFTTANAAVTNAAAAFGRVNTVYTIANTAYDKANSANVLAFNTGAGANAFLLAVIAGANTAVGTAANAFASATIAGANVITLAAFAKANAALPNTSGATFAGDLNISGNVAVDTSTLIVDKNSNRVGIGTTVPNTAFEVATTGEYIRHSSATDQGYFREFGRDNASTGNFYIRRAQGGTPVNDFTIDTSGNTGLGTNTPGSKLEVVGQANVTSSLLVAAMNVVPTIQAAFAAANTGTSVSSAYGTANAAFSAANASFGTANAAFAKANTAVVSVTGTANQISVTGTTSVTLSTPQDIGTSSNVQFRSIGVGTAASGTTGEIRATNDVTAYYSDRRLKQGFILIQDAVNKVTALNGVFFWENEIARNYGYSNPNRQVGVIAQEIQAVLPEAVSLAPFDTEYVDGKEKSKSGEHFLTVKYEKIIPLLIEAIKEQQREIEDLKRKIGL